jgi:hypothetical protein
MSVPALTNLTRMGPSRRAAPPSAASSSPDLNRLARLACPPSPTKYSQGISRGPSTSFHPLPSVTALPSVPAASYLSLSSSSLRLRPHWPSPLEPQAYSLCSVVAQSICDAPQAIRATRTAEACPRLFLKVTRVGSYRGSLSSKPSCPLAFVPQVNTQPEEDKNALKLYPASAVTMCWERREEHRTNWGTQLSVFAPWPVCPLFPSPQLHTEPDAVTAKEWWEWEARCTTG